MTTTTAVACALGAVLFALALLHLWWATGRLGASVVIPKVRGRPAFTPSRRSTLIVATLLLAATTIALSQGQVLPDFLPRAPLRWAAMAAGTVFLLRALGEFRLIGFFKRVRNTDFARWDTWCFSPLSASMGSAFWYLACVGPR
jgi:Protein of unknown function (DUF3995)